MTATVEYIGFASDPQSGGVQGVKPHPPRQDPFIETVLQIAERTKRPGVRTKDAFDQILDLLGYVARFATDAPRAEKIRDVLLGAGDNGLQLLLVRHAPAHDESLAEDLLHLDTAIHEQYGGLFFESLDLSPESCILPFVQGGAVLRLDRAS